MYLYPRIADLNLNQSFIRVWFNLATIRFADQAGGGLSDALMPGLSHDKAEQVYQIISEHMLKK